GPPPRPPAPAPPAVRAGRAAPRRAARAAALGLPAGRAGFSVRRTNQPQETHMTPIGEHGPSERAKVEGWRLHVLIEAGYPLPLAERLAHSDADLHAAVELIPQSCEAKIPAEDLLYAHPSLPPPRR